MRDFTESELVDLQIKYKNDQTVLDLIEIVKECMSFNFSCREDDEVFNWFSR